MEMWQRAEGEKIQGRLESAGGCMDCSVNGHHLCPHGPCAKLKGRNQSLSPSYLAAHTPFPSTFSLLTQASPLSHLLRTRLSITQELIAPEGDTASLGICFYPLTYKASPYNDSISGPVAGRERCQHANYTLTLFV